MDHSALQRRLQEAEARIQHLDQDIAFQQQMIARLEGGGHDVRAARMFLRRLRAQRAKHAASRDQFVRATKDPLVEPSLAAADDGGEQ
jgi:uncharacterized coiled-coil protein SlyX